MSSASRNARRLVQLAPAILVTLTALFALPHEAGGFRLAKWSAFGLALGAIAVALLVQPAPLRLPRSWFALGAFVASAVALPAFSPALGKSVAMAYMRTPSAEPGTEVSVGSLSGRVRAAAQL